MVQAQLEENRQRKRDRAPKGQYLLQGLVVCKRCGYGCYGKPTSRASAKGPIPYAYYRCTGSDAYRFGGERLCWNKQVRTDLLDAAVWADVRGLLAEPGRVRVEYERRRQKRKPGDIREVDQVMKLIQQVKKSFSRLIDAYGEGLVEKAEFEPRISAARERLSRLEDKRKRTVDEESQESELRLVIGQLEEFATRVREELKEPEWTTQREIIRSLGKQVEIDEGEVHIVYRVSPSPFESSPRQGRSQHCWGREWRALRCPFVTLGADAVLQQPRFEEATHDAQQTLVGDTSGQSRHQDVMVDPVKELFQVHIHHDDTAFRHVFPGLEQGVVRPTLRSEAVAGIREGRVQQGFQHLEDRLLHEAVDDRRDAQLSHPDARLGRFAPRAPVAGDTCRRVTTR